MDWNVKKPALVCSTCGANLEGAEFYSSLKDSGIDFERLDFCVRCWGEAGKEMFFSYWKTRHVQEEKARTGPRYVDADTMLEIFRKLAKEEPEGKEVFTFLLGMVLVQKRVLKYIRSESRGERDFVVLAHAKSGESFNLSNPTLSEEEMHKARENFDAILDTQSK